MNYIELYQKLDNIVGEITEEVFNKIIDGSKFDWINMVDTLDDLPPNPEEGTAVGVIENNTIYRYNGSEWISIQKINLNPIAEVDDRLSSQLADIVINAKDFGLDEQNEDNTESINNAINYVETRGKGTVFIPDGSYVYKNDIHIKRGVTVKGGGNTKLICGADSNAKVIFYKETTLKNFRFKFPEAFNDVAFDFVNENMSPYDEGGVKPDTSNVQVDVYNIRIDKPFDVATQNATAFRLLSTGTHGNEIYSGFWGVNFNNVKVLGFNLVYLLKTENNGWINGCKFDKIVADKFVNFMRVDRSENDLGVDFNTVINSDLQSREQTRDLFIVGFNSNISVENTSFWDMRTNPHARVGDITLTKNIRDFESIPKSRYISFTRGGRYYLLGRFTRSTKSSVDHFLLKATASNNYETDFLVDGTGSVEVRVKGTRNSNYQYGVSFFVKNLDGGQREVYLKTEGDVYNTFYFESINNFAISSREYYETEPEGLSELLNRSIYGNDQYFLSRIDQSKEIAKSDNHIIAWDRQVYNYGSLKLESGDTQLTVGDSIKRIRISLSIRVTNVADSEGRIRTRLLKNGLYDYSGSCESYLNLNGSSSIRTINMTSPILNVDEGDYFEVEISRTDDKLNISNHGATWISAEVIE